MVEVEGVLVVNSHGIAAKDLCHLRMDQVVYVRLFMPSTLERASLLSLSRDLVLALKDARYPIASVDL